MKFFLICLALVIAVPGLSACVHSAVYTSRVEKTYPPAGQFVENNGERIHVIRRGESGPAVLMIHGASANAEEFTDTLAPRLEETHRILIADRPGHGYSSRPDKAHRLGVQAAQMATAIETLTPGEKVTVVGHSFGGAVALRLGLDRPDLVAALVLLAPVSHDWGGGGETWYNTAAARPVFGPVFSQLVPIVGPAQVKGGIDGVFHPSPAPKNYLENSAIPLLFRPAEFRANAKDVTHLRAELAAQEERYGELKMPVTIFSGRRDTVIKPQLHAGKLRHQVPQLNLVDLPDGGHMPHHAYGEDVAEAIRELSSASDTQ